jgi:acyl-CoA thioesterase
MHLFDQDTLPYLDPISDGSHPSPSLVLGNKWNIGNKPNGGYTLAASARTMCAHTVAAGSSHFDPVTITAHYLRPAQPGPATVDTEVIRLGRTFTTAQGSLVQPSTPADRGASGDATKGSSRVHTLATFGTLPESKAKTHGARYVSAVMPNIPPPDECLQRDDELFVNESSIAKSTDIRMHPDTGWITGNHTGIPTSTGWIRFTDGREPDPWALLYFADALAPTVFELLPDRVWVPTIELTVHVFAKPAPGWILGHMWTDHVEHGRFEEVGELWDSTGALVAQSRQLAMILS